MKTISSAVMLLLYLVISAGCTNSGTTRKEPETAADSINVPDSIVKYYSNLVLLKEVSFRGGVRNGLTKTYYRGGQLYQTFWYVNDLREDSSAWYYLEGQVFRTTPYKHDTIDGIQRQYYRTGEIRAKIGFSKGLRTNYFEEYNKDGKRIKGYPEIVAAMTDEYKSGGRYRIDLTLSDNNKRVKFYRGEFTDNRFDTAKCQLIKTYNGKASLVLKKTGNPGKGYVGIISESLTALGNKYLYFKKIDLPYNDLN